MLKTSPSVRAAHEAGLKNCRAINTRLPKSVKQHRSSCLCFVCVFFTPSFAAFANSSPSAAPRRRAPAPLFPSVQVRVGFRGLGFFLFFFVVVFCSVFEFYSVFFVSPTPEEKAPRSNAALRRCQEVEVSWGRGGCLRLRSSGCRGPSPWCRRRRTQ